jgi:hypothetical protein
LLKKSLLGETLPFYTGKKTLADLTANSCTLQIDQKLIRIILVLHEICANLFLVNEADTHTLRVSLEISAACPQGMHDLQEPTGRVTGT